MQLHPLAICFKMFFSICFGTRMHWGFACRGEDVEGHGCNLKMGKVQMKLNLTPKKVRAIIDMPFPTSWTIGFCHLQLTVQVHTKHLLEKCSTVPPAPEGSWMLLGTSKRWCIYRLEDSNFIPLVFEFFDPKEPVCLSVNVSLKGGGSKSSCRTTAQWLPYPTSWKQGMPWQFNHCHRGHTVAETKQSIATSSPDATPYHYQLVTSLQRPLRPTYPLPCRWQQQHLTVGPHLKRSPLQIHMLKSCQTVHKEPWNQQNAWSLDIQMCTLVIQFDLFLSFLSSLCFVACLGQGWYKIIQFPLHGGYRMLCSFAMLNCLRGPTNVASLKGKVNSTIKCKPTSG